MAYNMTALHEADTSTALLEQITVEFELPNGDLIAYVPMGLVKKEEVALDEIHAADLTTKFDESGDTSRNRGQRMPAWLGHVPAEPQLLVIDGFHRYNVQLNRNSPFLYSSITPNMTLAEVYDRRIIATTEHEDLQDARAARFVNDMWSVTEWSNKGITASQAMIMLMDGDGERFGVGPNLATSIAEWASDKCTQWHIEPKDMYAKLTVGSALKPEIAQMVRPQKSGEPFAFTPKHSAVVAKYLPDMYVHQDMAVQTIMLRRLSPADARHLVIALARARTIDDAAEINDKGEWRIPPRRSGSQRQPSANRGTVPEQSRPDQPRGEVYVPASFPTEASESRDPLLDFMHLHLSLGRYTIVAALAYRRMSVDQAPSGFKVNLGVPLDQMNPAPLGREALRQLGKELFPLPPLTQRVRILSKVFGQDDLTIAQILRLQTTDVAKLLGR